MIYLIPHGRKKTVPIIDNLVFGTEEKYDIYYNVLKLPKKSIEQ